MKTALSAFPATVSITNSSSVSDADFKALKTQVDGLSKGVVDLARIAVRNRWAIARLLDVYAAHTPLFEVAGIYTVHDLAALNGNDRRSALSKMSKSESWPSEKAKQLTPDQFKEICEAAKVVTQD